MQQNPAMLAAMLQQMPPELLQQLAQAAAGGQGGAGAGAGGQPNPAAIMAMLQNPQLYAETSGLMHLCHFARSLRSVLCLIHFDGNGI